MNNLQDKGRACYRRGEYKQAIEFFDRAIGHASSVQLLDNRAACYEKLNNLQSALKDAKAAIQLHREDATGYLRAGKVLTKMEKESVALEIYTHGLKCIKHVGQGYELLRKANIDLMTKLCPPKSVDPMTMLPRELAEIILEHLTFKQRMNACLVSTQWAKFIRSCPDLWNHLDLTNPRKKVRNAFISRAINVGRQKLSHATLSNLWDIDKAIGALVKHCPLESLHLRENGLVFNLSQTLSKATCLTSLRIDSTTEIPSDQLEPLLRAHPQLKQFWISLSKPGLSRTVSEWISSVENLTSLTVDDRHNGNEIHPVDVRSCRELKYLDVTGPFYNAMDLRLPPSITTCKIRSTLTSSSANFWLLPLPGGSQPSTLYLPRLEELRLEIPRMVIHNVKNMLIGSDEAVDAGSFLSFRLDSDEVQIEAPNPEDLIIPSKLRKLSIIGAKLNYLQTAELFKHPRLGALELLHLPQLQSCCDEDVFGMIDGLPNLTSLDLSENDITGVAIRRIVDSGKIRELMVNDCRKLGSDAVDLARRNGIKVQYRMSDGTNGGRKVRS